MKHPALLATLLCLLLTGTALTQARFSGNVVEVIDGRTIVIETSGGKVTAQLQYIDVPEASQPMHAVVREQLSKHILGKHVDFRAVQLQKDRTIGQVVVSGVDISLQMLRDGAAWHEPVASTGQPVPEAAVYAQTQELAKSEKRGLWSQPGLRPAWEVRAEQLERQRKAELEARANKPIPTGVSQYQTATRRGGSSAPSPEGEQGAWADVFGGVGKESVGLQTYKDPGGTFDVVYTSLAFVYLVAGEKKHKVECRVGYVTYNLRNGTRTSVYLVAFRSISSDYDFSTKRSAMTVVADKQSATLGFSHGFRGREYYGAQELFFYRITKPTLKRMATGKDVELRVNGYRATVPEDAKYLFKQLVDVTG